MIYGWLCPDCSHTMLTAFGYPELHHLAPNGDKHQMTLEKRFDSFTLVYEAEAILKLMVMIRNNATEEGV